MASNRGQIVGDNVNMRDNISGDNAQIRNQTFEGRSVAKNQGIVNYGGTSTNIQGGVYSGRDTNLGGNNYTGNFGTIGPNPNVGKMLKEGEDGKVAFDQLPEQERNIKDKFLSVSFLLEGARIQDYICKIYVKDGPEGAYTATGFLVAKDVLMTNHHVFPNESNVVESIAIFGYNDSHHNPNQKSVDIVKFLTSDKDLDFALVRIAESMPDFIRLPQVSLKFAKGQYANIIGHPNGNPKMVSLRSNKISEVMQNVIEYTSDTEPGSSGSPVFNNSWKLIALHSSAGSKDSSGNWISNKGIRIDRIVAKINQLGNI